MVLDRSGSRSVWASDRQPAVRLSTVIFALSSGALTLLCGCADLLDIAENPMLVAPDPWLCTPGEPIPAPPARDKATVRVRACNFISTNCGTRVKGITAKLCDKKDVNCAAPIQADI